MRYLMLGVAFVGLFTLPARAVVDKTAIDKAIDRGVRALKSVQGSDGKWPYAEIGATALAALTLLECDVPKTDKSIAEAAKAIREAALNETKTYSISLVILFLDRLDDPADTPLIEGLIVRLMSGQQHAGGWSYECPIPSAEDLKRISAEMDRSRTLRGSRDLGKMPTKGKRTVKDLPKELQVQLDLINKGHFPPLPGPAGAPAAVSMVSLGDNSNTQFATLALWVGRRYGVPTQDALLKVSQRFRLSQNPDGGWSYIPTNTTGRAGMMADGFSDSSAQMTCAGILALAFGHGSVLDKKKEKDDKVESQDVSKDDMLKKALGALSSAVGTPLGWNGVDARPAAMPAAAGKAFYYLWSLERVCVALNIEKLAKKDWYNWGAEILLANQAADGSWSGEYGRYGADTCFALLFLKKANFTRDLSGGLRGLRDSVRDLRAGGVGGSGLKAPKPLTSAGIGTKGKTRPAGPGTGRETTRPSTAETRPALRPPPIAKTAEEKSAVRLGEDYINATGAERGDLLKKLRDNKGVTYTETLVWVISRVEGEGRKQARVALAERFTRLKDATLREYLGDDEPEIRRAAALAAAARGSKSLVPDLIRRLNDPAEDVQRAAHTALKELTSKDFGPRAGATASERKDAIAAWLRWWKENSRE
jgi:hypothetical protein